MKKISALVIDDNIDVVTLFRTLFQSEGILCDTAQNGREAMEKLGRNRYDIVFTDLIMPDLDGETLLGHLRRTFPSLHIVVMSVQDDDGVINGVMALGAKAYLVKPCSAAAILDCVHNVERHRTADEVRADLLNPKPPPAQA
ncbi:MAG: response regulator [Verrucomicrobia bacterium]|nr:response regulator [Verrucomicrobiota bacterium]